MSRTFSAGAWLRMSAMFVMALLIPILATFGPEARADDPPLGPIDPNNAEQTLLDLVKSLPINDVDSALDQYPVPFITCATANGADATCVTQKAGVPARVNADASKATGQGGGGQDVEVEVNTELLPTPHLVLTINRLGTSNFASDLQVVVAFPFDAFNYEDADLGGDNPNLFFGYRTTAAFDNVANNYPAGGTAPASVEFVLTPDILAGANHLLDMQINTVGANNPVQYLAGHFDGTSGTGVQDALAVAALADPVPANMTFGLDVSQNLFTTPATGTDSNFALTYDASSATKMVFSYLESEDFPFSNDGPDFGTTLTVDQMPTHEELSIDADFAARTLTLSSESDTPIGKITVEHKRRDGLVVTGTAEEVPTDVNVTLDFAGALTIDVDGTGFGEASPNTMDIDVIAKQQGGFPGTSAFFGYPIGYAQLTLENVPDMSAAYDDTLDSFSIQATNPGESIDSAAFIIGDDDDLELPSRWSNPAWHDFSLIDDGTHGTAAARVVDLQNATLKLDGTPLGETFDFALGSRSPMQLYVETAPASALTGKDVLAACEVQDMPEGTVHFEIDFPNQFLVTATPDDTQVINSITCSGHIDTLNYELGVGGLPMNSGYNFDPNGELKVKVEPGGVANTARIGFITVRLWDETNPLPLSAAASNLFGALHDARMRADGIPSFVGTWSDAASTKITFNAGQPAVNNLYLDGLQMKVSTEVGLAPLPVGSSSSDDYLELLSDPSDETRLGAGVFGLNALVFDSIDGAGNMIAGYDSSGSRKLTVDLDSRFGGAFFPNYDYDMQLVVNKMPASFDLTTNLSTQVSWIASSGIDAITLDGTVDNSSGNGTGDETTADVTISSLPSEFDLDVDPLTGATLVTNDAGTMDLDLKLSSADKILGSKLGLIELHIDELPAKFTGAWSGGDFLIEFKDKDDNPSKLGSISALVSSTSDPNANAAKINPFTLAGDDLPGVITTDTSGCRVQYSEYLQVIDKAYWSIGSDSVLSRLNLLYCDSEKLDDGEDHIIAVVKSGDLDFASFQFSDLQKVLYDSDPNGPHFELKVPTAEVHPLFLGVGLDDEFLTGQFGNVPDSTVVDVDMAAQLITFDTSEQIGEIDFYYGPLPKAGEGDRAFRAILKDTPTHVGIKWVLSGTSGDAWFDASNEFEILFLAQVGGFRIAAGMEMEDLHAFFGLEGPGYPDCDPVADIDTCYGLLRATAGIDNDADGFASTRALNPGMPAVSAFVAVYELIGSPAALQSSICPGGTCPAAVGKEFVPLVTAVTDGFIGAILQFEIQFDPLLPTSDFWPIDFETNVTGPTGAIVLDIWDQGFDVNFGVDTYHNDPDYIENNPWHILPVDNLNTAGLHDFGDHTVDPFD